MTTSTSSPINTEDIYSVGSRISWPAILAGAAIAIAFQFLFGILALVLGGPASSTSRAVEPISTGAIVWMIATAIVSLFAGGVVTSLLTAGENKVEAAIYGIVMWATVTVVVAHGASSGLGAMMHHAPSQERWDSAALNAGVPADQVQQWRTKLADTRPETDRSVVEISPRARWWAFGVTWLSMLAATIGALVGAGPTFRLIAVSRTSVPASAGRI